MVRALDLPSKSCGFKSRPFHFPVTTLGKLFIHYTYTSVTKQYNLVPAKGWVVFCLGREVVRRRTDSVVWYIHLRQNSLRKGDEHLVYAPVEYGTFTLT